MTETAQPPAMRIVFAGTPDFARVAMERLHLAGHTLALVLTQPDRPAGRGMKLQASAVKNLAVSYGVPVSQPRSLRLDGKFPEDAQQARQAIADARADVMVVAAYGLLLPQWVLDDMQRGHYGCLNIHGSLLPRWRGAAPIHRAIEAGDSHTGVTIMQMDAGLDTGDILLAQRMAITDEDSTASLHDKVADLGAELIVQVLRQLAAGTLRAIRQPAEGVTYAHKILKAEAWLDWQCDAMVLARRVRAFDPFPVACAALQGATPAEPIKIWKASVVPDTTAAQAPAPAGTIIATGTGGIDVATGAGILRLLELQRPGGKRLPAGEFLQGFALAPGQRFADAQSHST